MTLIVVVQVGRTNRTAADYYTGGWAFTGSQNGLAIAGDFLSAASFLGIAGLIAVAGFDGVMFALGALVTWVMALVLIAEMLRNTGRFTVGDVLAFRMRQRPVRAAAATSTLVVCSLYISIRWPLGGVSESKRRAHRPRAPNPRWTCSRWPVRRERRSSCRTSCGALADPVRLTAVRSLAGGGATPSGALLAGVMKSAQADHRRVLRESGILWQRPSGREVLLSLRSDDLDARFPGLLDAIVHDVDVSAPAATDGGVPDRPDRVLAGPGWPAAPHRRP